MRLIAKEGAFLYLNNFTALKPFMLERGVYKFIEEGDSGYQLILIKNGISKGTYGTVRPLHIYTV